MKNLIIDIMECLIELDEKSMALANALCCGEVPNEWSMNIVGDHMREKLLGYFVLDEFGSNTGYTENDIIDDIVGATQPHSCTGGRGVKTIEQFMAKWGDRIKSQQVTG